MAEQLDMPVLQLTRERIAELAGPDGAPSPGIATLFTVMTETDWRLSVTPVGQRPREFSAMFHIAVEARHDDDSLEMQAFARCDLAERVFDQLVEAGPAEAPARVRRPFRVPPVLLRTLATDGDELPVSDAELLEILVALPPEFSEALRTVSDARLLERTWVGSPLGMARLLVLNCGEHGRWALWERLDANEPWNFGTARAQRVDDARLAALVRESIGDLVAPEPEPGPVADIPSATPTGSADPEG